LVPDLTQNCSYIILLSHTLLPLRQREAFLSLLRLMSLIQSYRKNRSCVRWCSWFWFHAIPVIHSISHLALLFSPHTISNTVQIEM